MPDQLKLAILGCDPEASERAILIAELFRLNVVAVADREIEKTRRLAEHFGVPAYDSLAKMVEEEGKRQGIDCLLVALPDDDERVAAFEYATACEILALNGGQ